MADRLLDPSGVTTVIAGILGRSGCDDDEAGCVAGHLVEASLRGHDSHGIIRIMRYRHWLEAGVIHAGRELKVIADTGAMLHLDGQSGMGQRMARDATAMGIDRARQGGCAIVAMRRGGHIGRLGAYAEQAMEAGLVSVHFVNVAGARLVAPFGTTQRLASTNPVAIGVPNPGGDSFVLDFATSLVAEGKAMVAARGGKPLPEGALIDGAGQRSADPSALYGDTVDDDVPDPTAGPGALRAMGEHKGSGLALACELLAGALTGNGTNGPGETAFGNGLLSILVDPARMDDAGSFGAEVAAYIACVQAASPAAGTERVMIPGDPERARRTRGMADGLPVPDAVAQGIADLAARLDVDSTAMSDRS